jgi:hypothetical protein
MPGLVNEKNVYSPNSSQLERFVGIFDVANGAILEVIKRDSCFNFLMPNFTSIPPPGIYS